MLLAHDGVDLDYDECIGVTYDDVRSDPDAALATIVERYKAVEAQCDAVVIVGSDYTDVGSPAELAYNARIAANLGAPVLLVLGGRAAQGQRRAARLVARRARPPRWARSPTLALAELAHGRAELLAVVANRADPDALAEIVAAIRAVGRGVAAARRATAGAGLGAPRGPLPGRAVDARHHALGRRRRCSRATPTCSPARRSASSSPACRWSTCCRASLEGAIVVIPADRTEVLLATLLANASGTFPSLAGHRAERRLPAARRRSTGCIDGLGSTLPIIATDLGTYETAVRIMNTRGRLAADSQRRYDTALALFEQHVDTDELARVARPRPRRRSSRRSCSSTS